MAVTHDLQVEQVPLDALTPHPRNPRNADVDLIAHSLSTNGQYRPIVVARGGVILAGNHTHAAACSLGWDTISVVRVDLDPDSDAARRIMLVDNRSADLGQYDEAMLLDLLQAVSEADLASTGYQPADLDRLAKAIAPVNRDRPRLADLFGVPPFTLLNSAKAEWTDRKEQWRALGVDMHGGREGFLVRGKNVSDGQYYQKKSAREDRLGRPLSEEEWAEMHAAEYQPNTYTSGTSGFDPVLAELALRWFSPPGCHVFDPCAGGSTRGLVASVLGYAYTGNELRPVQIAANAEAMADVQTVTEPVWRLQDSTVPYGLDRPADVLLTCPPYFDLERYSDDPRDLSTMTWQGFRQAHRALIRNALAHLADDRFAVWVVSDVRDQQGYYRGIVADTIDAFQAEGCRLYNDLILVHRIGSGIIRAARSMRNRKVVRIHEHVLVFCKGDWRAANEACGPLRSWDFGTEDEPT